MQLVEQVKPVADSPWFWGIPGLVVFVIGLLLVIRPKQSGERWWRLQRAMRPWPLPRWPWGVTLAAGCLALVVGVLFLGVTWDIVQGH
jgi:uncharacterized membrane protein HdeD (DUF308 family)